MTDLTEQLTRAKARYESLCRRLEDPATAADQASFRDISREIRRLTPIIEAFDASLAAQADLDEALQILQTESDAELRSLAELQRTEARERLEKTHAELTVLLLPHDPNDEKNVIVEIRAGAGGEEAALFAAVLYRMYSMYAAAEGFSVSVVGSNPTELGGYKEISFLVEGEGAYSRLKFESGVHRVQRVPETESGGRIHTSTVTVAVLPEAEEVEIEINESDLKIETIKSSGAGGQHVNKTESAVRLIHIPSGIVIECQDERSQYKNRDKAMKLLRSRLLDLKRSEQNDRIAADRKNQVGSGDRSERVRTYNYPQGRVTDHRIGLTLHSLDAFLNGAIAPMLSALAASDTARKLAEAEGGGRTMGETF